MGERPLPPPPWIRHWAVHTIPEILKFFYSGSVLVSNFQNFSAQQSSLSTPLCACICHRDRADLLYITGVMVHSSAFCMPGYALDPVSGDIYAICGQI